jgi:dethiobiotin synthetase
MTVVFITGTGTDIGKTYVSAALIRALIASGRTVDALKPVVSGFDAAAPAGSDPAVLLAALGLAWSPAALERMSPFRYRAPLSPPLAARREGRRLDFEAMVAVCAERIAGSTDRTLLIEGAGGVMSPVDDDHTMLDLMAAIGTSAILVAGSYLGTISHTLTAVQSLRSAGVGIAAIVISGSNGEPPPVDETVDALARHLGGVPLLTAPRGPAWDAGPLAALIP